MDFDSGWAALLRPGKATTFFSPAPDEPLRPDGHFSCASAWWLAELSRLGYRRSGRGGHLAEAGFRELEVFHSRGIQATLTAAVEAVGPAPRVLVFRGTDSARDWLWNLDVSRDSAGTGGEVHRGFSRALDQIWGDAERALAAIDGPLAYTGHSLGGALAVLAAARRPPDAVYTFGAPRVGDRAFADGLEGVAVFQIVNNDDLVTRLAPPLARRPFHHAGTLYRIVSRSRRAAGPKPLRETWSELSTPFDVPRRALGPPRVLCDHAPVNYVAHLERLGPERA